MLTNEWFFRESRTMENGLRHRWSGRMRMAVELLTTTQGTAGQQPRCMPDDLPMGQAWALAEPGWNGRADSHCRCRELPESLGSSRSRFPCGLSRHRQLLARCLLSIFRVARLSQWPGAMAASAWNTTTTRMALRLGHPAI